jgi:putative endonuclease
MYFVYILRSVKDKNLYIGFTFDVEKRLREHNKGEVTSTKARRPFELVYKETFENKEEANKREKFLKSGYGREFVKSVLNNS